MSKLRTYHFSLRLLSNVIVSQSSATAGDHQCLDYIPGGALLGVVATKIYNKLPLEQAQQVFHTNAVRFSDALPAKERESAWPVPMCWHSNKGESIYRETQQDKYLNANVIYDPSRKQAEQGKQPKQLREGYITASGLMLKSDKDYELKTAINAQTGSAADAQLFGYQSLKAGQVFNFFITVEADVNDEVLQLIRESLSGTIRLGRSRSAQFGQASIQEHKQAQDSVTIEQTTNNSKQLRLWLLSDLALMDDFGNPLLQPTAKSLGLPEGSQWRVESSFIRTRSYTPFNGKRRSYDLQRQVISRGSVLVFDLPRELSADELQELKFQGQYQSVGLGHIAVNPTLLESASPKFSKPLSETSQSLESEIRFNPDSSLLISVLRAKAQIDSTDSVIEQQAKELVCKFKLALVSAARWAGHVEDHYLKEIKRSQWGEIRSVALMHSTDSSGLLKKLFEGDHAPIRKRDGQAAWALPVNATEILAEKVKEAITESAKDNKVNLGLVLAHACSLLMNDSKLSQSNIGEAV